jgi:serine/alanine adding enzyme
VTLRVESFGGGPAEWDGFIRSAPGWTHFHRWGWKSVIERVTGHECRYLAARDPAGRLVGVLPLVRLQSRVFGRYFISMPFLNYGGPLGSDAAVQSLVAHAVELAAGDRTDLLELRSRTPLPVDLAVSHRKITVVLDLPAGQPGRLWESLKAKVRSQVRRPQKEGVEVRFGLEQAGAFYEVFSRHMRDLGTPTQPRRLFETVAQTFPEDVWFGCAYHRGRPIAGGCGFRWDGEFEMTWASALNEYNRMAPNMLVYWAFLERAAEQGVTLFNFGRCTPGSNTHRFKQQWGSRDVPLWWYQRAWGGRAATPSPDMAGYSWGPRVWRRLPLPLANLLGPRVVRLIP